MAAVVTGTIAYRSFYINQVPGDRHLYATRRNWANI